MKKKSKVLKGAIVAGITALTVPTFVHSQTSGSSSGSGSSGMSSGSSGSTSTPSGSTGSGSGSMGSGSSGTHSGSMGSGSTGTHGGSSGMKSGSASDMTGSTGSPGSSSSMGNMGSMSKDMATTDADKSLNSQIRQSMKADSSLGTIGENIHFSTNNGEVTLHGTVASESEKNLVEQKVKQMSNVKEVQNELKVGSVGSLSSGSSTAR